MADLNLTPSRDATSFASSSTFPSHGNTNSYVYDVFINHHGTGVKEGLASHIYHRLVAYGLRVFWDQHELQQGDNMTDQVEGAIRTASVHVAIFTPTYAESSRCLDELVLMLESGSGSGSFVPVFYKVKPSDLRWMRGAQSLGVLENKRTDDSLPRYDSSIIEKWRCALSVAADISGFELKAFNDDEGQLVNKVVRQVWKKVGRQQTLDVAKYPTGLAEKVKDVEITVSLQQHSGKPRIVGIVGLGGVGKTTLAKELFNRERSHYDRCCFLSDVRSRSLHSLQSIFLNDLTQLNVQINGVDEGIENLKRHLSPSDRVLIVLDDVDNIDQLNALFSPVKDTIHPNSLILVTSRNKDVLTRSGIVASSIYTLKGLNPRHSKELFCMNAFAQPHPVIGFAEMVEKFLEVCNGLPLSLKVLGALLRGKDDLGYWNAQLQKTSKILPSDIQSKLQISYDALDAEEKHIFLDIACFFIGEDVNTAIRIWDGSGWYGLLNLQSLENRCLVEVDSESCLRMHDHLRDLGRDLAENSEYPLRLWRSTDISVLPFDQPAVRGINTDVYNWLNPRELVDHLFAVTNMSKLQLLRGEGYHVESILRAGQSRVLTWLRWHNCPLLSLPSCITMDNLRVLQITGGSLETLWLHESQAPLQLRELNVDAPLLKVPNSIGKLKHLEKFVLHRTDYIQRVDLETLPDEFCHLYSLRHLELKKCGKMKSLPGSLGNLMKLHYIDLSECSSLQMLPYSIGSLTDLQHIDLSKCSSLQMLPGSIGKLTDLQYIDLSECSSLQMLPDSIGNLTHLQHIDLSECSSLQMLPTSFGNLTNLHHIDLSKCFNLQRLPDYFENFMNVQRIYLSRWSNLQVLPDYFGNFKNLQHIDLSGCSKMQVLPDYFGNFKNLQHIVLSGCSSLQMLPDSFANLTNLQHIYLSKCSSLHMIPDFIGKLTNLLHLDLSEFSSLQMLQDSIGNLTNLQHIDLSKCSSLQMLPHSIGNLTHLQYIDLSECSSLQMLPDSIGNLSRLQHIDLSECSSLQMLPDSIGDLSRLQHIDLSECSSLQMLPDSIGDLTQLQHIDLSECSSLQMLPDSIGNLTQLQHIDLSECSSLQILPNSFANLTNLHHIDLSQCSNLQMFLDYFENFMNLQRIYLSRLSNLQELPDYLGNFKNLQHIDLSGCSNLQELPDYLGNFKNLQHIDLSGCSNLETFPEGSWDQL